MAPNLLHLPNGANITVTPVFGGFYFKSNDYSLHHGSLPPGWTIIIHSEYENEQEADSMRDDEYGASSPRPTIHRYRTPTRQNDALFLSSISNPSAADFKSPVSPSRQIAMMLWSTLWWYFHQPRPNPQISTKASAKTPDSGKPKGDWFIRIKREGIFKGRHLMSKLERMGLIASEDSYVGLDPDDRGADGWEHMFVTQRAFWQIDPRIFLFTLSPAHNSPFPSSSPFPSRPSSPNRDGGASTPKATAEDLASHGLWSPTTPGPFYSASHLPTYYPPLPQQYKLTDGIRHPVRPKPPRQGETFYTRYIPSLGQYLSFRTPSLSAKGVVHSGPIGSATPSFLPPNSSLNSAAHSAAMANLQQTPSDTELLHKWMNDERVNAAWGEGGPIEKQENFLRENLQNRHSFPVIGCWDGKPFGYFEIYWVKEDILGKVAGGIDEWDRGLHVLVGENEYRGSDRVRVWMSALVHFCFLADSRTQHVLAEPRVDNKKIQGYFEDVGFFKEREVTLPHKQSALMKVLREAWEAPFL